MQKLSNKISILKKCIGKKYMVINIKDHAFLCEAFKVIDENNLAMKDMYGQTFDVSIFDIRNPNQEF